MGTPIISQKTILLVFSSFVSKQILVRNIKHGNIVFFFSAFEFQPENGINLFLLLLILAWLFF